MSTDVKESRTVAELKARAKELGVEDDPRLTRTADHRPLKADWAQVVQEAEKEHKPSQNDLIREGLLEGLSNEEIVERVEEVHGPDTSVSRRPAVRVAAVIHAERSRGSEWWMENRDTIGTHRPRVKLATPDEEEEGVAA